jgi:hypothetical protein
MRNTSRRWTTPERSQPLDIVFREEHHSSAFRRPFDHAEAFATRMPKRSLSANKGTTKEFVVVIEGVEELAMRDIGECRPPRLRYEARHL